ncbi:hypothetical protein ACLMJK_002116 [Lecanora helva]
MNQFYQQQAPMLPRRATEPVTLAPTASMIDPNLENHRIQQTQLPPNYARIHMQHNASAIHGQNNGYPTPHHPSSNGIPAERSLPLREVNENTIESAYVQFIMYCNPSIPLEVDTTELRKGFRSPPKSDGKSFSPFRLYELISRLEINEIKTWTQLVIELGVELPDAAKNQSSQKVQQYAVRLKRWLKVFHVDAFFLYLNNKSSDYFSERPNSNESLANTVRDTIPVEEDLAVRALLPEWRPKRGRRKAEELEAEAGIEAASKKQNVRATSTEFSSMFDEQYSAAPNSAMPWGTQPTQVDPWSAAQVAIAPKTPSTGQTQTVNPLTQNINQQMRWRFSNNNETPSSPYPQSAITPRQSFTTSPPFDEPKSAHPSTTSKSPSRTRKRHGPAVSSAWPSSSNTASGKLRGRPPSNRSVQDGPFSTFPVNPNNKDAPSVGTGTPTQGSPSPTRESTPQTQPSITFNAAPTLGDAAVLPKRSKLQLQVPEHSGGPVRLATPPRVLINGESNRQVTHTHERRSSADFFNQLDDVSEEDGPEAGDDEEPNVDWKKRAMTLRRKLTEKEEELRAIKRRVLDAVM